ncbi:MAG TPA: DUF2723 domain-containing protein [candidate division Zixibacteria bacterium]
MSFQRKTAFACILLLLSDLVVYLYTQAPVVQFIDSGELAVVCKILGIAHPTGYPLYTLIGRLFTLLPANDVIFRVNLFSLLSVCLTNLILFFIILKLAQKRSDLSIWTAFLTGLLFSFTPTLWDQATSNEVYGLNILFYSLIIFLVLTWRERFRKRERSNILYLLVFVCGLSFGNHMMIVLLLPAVAFILLSYEKKAFLNHPKIISLIPFFILGISIYLYLPIRSAQNPLLDWGNPENWSAFARHVSGWQYKVWMFSASFEHVFSNLDKFVKLFFKNFPPYLLLFTLLGMWRFITRDRRFFFFLLFIFFFVLIYAVNYSIPDLDPFFLGCFLVNVILVGNGLYLAFENLQKLKLTKIISIGIILLFIILPLILLKKNYFEQDKNQSCFAYDLNSNILRSARKDGLILTQLWGHYSPWLYLRYVELKRPDLAILSKDLCFYSWYTDYIKQNYPQIYKNSEDLITEYGREAVLFEEGAKLDLKIIGIKYLDMLNGFLSRNLNMRPVYANLVGEQEIGNMLVKIPEGLVYSMKDTLAYYPYDFPNFQLRSVIDQNVYRDERTRLFLLLYPILIGERIKYLEQFGMTIEADTLLEKYKSILRK